jgi:AraC family transcriptional regulator
MTSGGPTPRRQAVLATGASVRVMVHQYRPREHQRPHVDRCARISFPLRGCYRETAALGPMLLAPGDIVFKSRAAVHEDWFDPAGTTIASIELRGDAGTHDTEDALVRLAGPIWLVRRDAGALRLMLALLDAATAGVTAAVDAIATDLVAAGTGLPARRTAPPRWLQRLRAELETAGLAGTPVAARAREAGVHPVHASRLFRSCFGVTMTAHAQLHAVRRALALLPGARRALAQVAAAAGFCDQSHMNRVFHTVVGRPPGSIRDACAAALAAIESG